ncbi:hypothetical protein AXX17_AT4G32160 [Arabidopsis thaliana]|uniref:Uncharacterized protein n=1 Tax=Arabidopsis thaliana TaxID=3702 RepID=A0A178UWW5_ARATH|nr:hypothetical protein AXX17_AT4G32160 [Arabidopsis thaliana]
MLRKIKHQRQRLFLWRGDVEWLYALLGEQKSLEEDSSKSILASKLDLCVPVMKHRI